MNHSSIDDNELLARAIVVSGWFSQKDGVFRVKQDAFVPYPYQTLSVIRHNNIDESKIWSLSEAIASRRNKKLYGRADIKTIDAKVDGLDVIASPQSDNPNHADIVNWPSRKEDQKDLALRIAKAAQFIPNPNELM